ncbi:methyltransferase [Amycolatopsis sp. NPDC098790]|uniref:methyltransferase n=1 Tax=Amycolatopsis sp. NPDC098790 TaxID=3363939 RepID=UPI00382B0233
MTATIAPALAPEDLDRLAAAKDLVHASDTDSVLAAALPSLPAAERAALAAHAPFSHVALLIFPQTLDGLGEELARHGLETGPMRPSVVVRERLSRRYGVPARDLTAGILRAPVADRAGRSCSLEIFVLLTPPELIHIAADERRHGHESHFALAVPRADPIVLTGLRAAIAGQLRPDGGGYNGHEDATVLYFRDAHHPVPAYRRLELLCAGEFPRLLGAHRRESEPGTELLELLTGAWTTQAVATAVELRLPDHLTTNEDLATLAAATGADRDSLARLLQYLGTLGVVRATAAGYVLTEVGALLRSDVDGSMSALALMYGGPFYESFAMLTEAVRTGADSYAKVFGAHHFAHFAANPALADLFHRSMAAGNAMFAELTHAVDLSGAEVVVDVAGGSGALLSRVLDACPAARGILMDRPEALATAEATLARHATRCTSVAGDFTEAVPGGGDVYLLSRVLHDWDDARCLTILRTCAAGMPAEAELLIVERLLPESEGTASLAVPWDIHMLCNVGGRERTESHYRALLAGAGLELTDVRPLALDAHVLRARKAVPHSR